MINRVGKILSTPTPYKWNDISNVDFWMTMWGINNDIDHGLPIAPLHWYKNKKYRYSAALLQLLIICEIKVCLKLLQTF